MQNNNDDLFKILGTFGLVLSLVKMVNDEVRFCCVNMLLVHGALLTDT